MHSSSFIVDEFTLIRAYFSQLGASDGSHAEKDGVVLGIGDDCAILQPPSDSHLVVSTDTFIAGVHFPTQTDPFDIGFKALAVNLSDLAAMGALPLWFTLCITLPDVDEAWLAPFCKGMGQLAARSGIRLVGGDTTKGPLSISIHVTGAVPRGRALTRSAAQVGDDVYVSGEIGHGAAGLYMAQTVGGDWRGSDAVTSLSRFNRPEPRLALGKALQGVATSAIDISDGVLVDLRHILVASQTNAELDMQAIPLAPALGDERVHAEVPLSQRALLACSAGDDYELCFTASVSQREYLTTLSGELGVPVSIIGRVTAPAIGECGGGIVDARTFEAIAPRGYHHF